MSRPPLPPFTRETAAQKTRMAEDGWNARDPERVSLAYTEDSGWRNRSEFFEGRAAIVDQGSLKLRWQPHCGAVQYEWLDDAGQWHRS
jgi:uncharacterized protein